MIMSDTSFPPVVPLRPWSSKRYACHGQGCLSRRCSRQRRNHCRHGSRSPRTTRIDAAGKYVIPGGVDVHDPFADAIGRFVSTDDFYHGTRPRARRYDDHY